jgi:hypothetical protein
MGAVLKQCAVSAMALVVLLLAGCSQTTESTVNGASKAGSEAAKGPAEPVTAKTAFWPMYTSARHWATDVVILRLTPKDVTGYKNEAGKAAEWEAMFGSPSQRQSRLYTYAIASVPPDVFKGVSAGLRVPWEGSTRDAMPVALDDFNIDSDAAYQAATTDGAAWLKKNPDKQLTAFALGDTYRFQAPVWYLMWGDKKAGYVAFVDANNGKILKK